VGEKEIITDQKNAIGAMLVQIAILFGSAALSYLDSIATLDPFANAGNSALAAYFFIFGGAGIWLAGEYSVGNVKSSRIALWSILCLILALYPIIISTGSFIIRYSFGYLFIPIAPLLFFISSIAVLVFTWGYDD
jgi:hypothetical protein